MLIKSLRGLEFQQFNILNGLLSMMMFSQIIHKPGANMLHYLNSILYVIIQA